MLSELYVRDLGVIRDLRLEFGPGMTVLTGETGAGKTLLVQALALVTGGRTVPGLVRAGADDALVEARFVTDHIPDEPAPDDAAARPDTTVLSGVAHLQPVETILSREVPVSGRSRAWINGRMAPASALSEAGDRLVDIHGQHDQHALLSAAAQRAALDAYAGSDFGPLRAARQVLSDVVRRLGLLGGDERERALHADLLRYQVTEIDAAGLGDPDEDSVLEAEEDRLAGAADLRVAAAQALSALEDDDGGRVSGGASGLVGTAIAALDGRPALAPWDERLRSMLAEMADVATDLREVVETWEDDPERLANVQERRRLLADLRRKYGDTIADVVAHGEQARQALDELQRHDVLAAELEAARIVAEEAVSVAAAALRAVRLSAAPELGAAVTGRLRDLAMPAARLEVTVGDDGPGDDVEILLGANAGEPIQPLARVASGGELSRTMLALRLVVEGGAPTVLFDEVDAGVGGEAAIALARALREVADTRQVLVVTHLPQIAAFADRHVLVRKTLDEDGRTVTGATFLHADERVVELARMLSGHPDSPTARAHAEELLAAARSSKESTTAVAPGD